MALRKKEVPHLVGLLGEGGGLVTARARAGAGGDTEREENQGSSEGQVNPRPAS